MKRFMAPLWRLTLAALVSITLLIMTATVIQQPADVSTFTYNAEFADVSGLHGGADVRIRGVQVGKVEALELERTDGRSIAKVRFTLDRKFSIVPKTRLGVRFQALTGLRYIDVADAAEGDVGAGRITDVPTSMTIPSFDVTVLFNGLQPVLATMSPEDINTFTDNVAAFLAGDGSGLGPMLESVGNLTALVSNREQVIETIVHNLAVLADGIAGRSQHLPEVLEELKVPVKGAMTVLDEFRKSKLYGHDFTTAVVGLFDAAGIKPGINIDKAFDKAITNIYDNMDILKRMPVIWENIESPPVVGTPAPCSKGRAVLPLPMDVLLNGRKVVLCNQP